MVLLYSFLLLTLVASVMQWSLTERRLNSRSAYWLEARNAAEAASEYGCYQVAQAFSAKMNPTFGSGGTAVAMPSSFASSFFSGSNVTQSSIEVRAGTVTKVPATSLYYVSPLDPNNRYDPMVGRYVYRRDVTVLGKVTVTPPTANGGPVTSYVMQKVSIRGAPLFAYAIFYSGNDLEVNPLPQMDIWGPVHVNGNLFVGSVSNGVSLNFHGPVTASGNVFHAWRGTTSTAQQSSTMSSSSAVQFPIDSTGTTLVSMRTAGGTWNDSTMGASAGVSGLANLQALVTPTRTTQFAAHASQTWKGNLQTAAHGIQSYNPMGFSEVVAVQGGANVLATDDIADDAGVIAGTGASGVYGQGYGPHSLIEPPLTVSSTDTYKVAKDAIEEQKFSNKAALYVKVEVDGSDNATIKLYGDPRSAPSGTPAAQIGPNNGLLLATATFSGTTGSTVTNVTGTFPSGVVNYVKYVRNASNQVTSGMYDQRQDKGVNLVQLNIGNLRTALNDMIGATTNANITITKPDGTKWGSGSTNGYDKYTTTSTGWNGGIYVDVSSSTYPTKHSAIVLSNGQVTSGTSLVPTVNNVNGLTVATNVPAYILGHFNADGTIGSSGTSNSALWPDDTASGTPITSSTQSPVCIAADTVTILSPNYFNTSGTKVVPSSQASGNAYNSYTTQRPNASGSTEIAAAIISGSNTTSPSGSGTQEYSGGVHNMPRFLETWTGNTVAIRGSLVSMYNTRYATGIWASSYYQPPNRQWGFDQLFANGTYPPICPQVISYRRVDFTFLANEAAYNAEVAKL